MRGRAITKSLGASGASAIVLCLLWGLTGHLVWMDALETAGVYFVIMVPIQLGFALWQAKRRR